MSLVTARAQFIIPAERTNLITNPSFKSATTGYTAASGFSSIAITTNYSRRGHSSCVVTPTSGQYGGMYYAIALTSGVTYTFSLDVIGSIGHTYSISFSNTSSEAQSTVLTWGGTGYWHRRSLTWTATSTATFRLFFGRNAVASTAQFCTDGWQLEQASTPSTYLDGDMVGFRGEKGVYRWNGTPHASTSWRSGQTRSGGTYVSLATYAKLLAIVGLGMNMVSNVSVPSNIGGEFYQNTIDQAREFTLICNMTGGGDYAVIQAKLKAIEAALGPDIVSKKQPLLIQYDQLDANGTEISETLMIPCTYERGLEGGGDYNVYAEKVPITFKMYMPLVQQQGETGIVLGYQTSIGSANYMVMRTTAGSWSAMSGSLNGYVANMAASNDGGLYFGGVFSQAGAANTVRIAKWNGAAVEAVGTGLNDYVLALAIGPDNSLYVGGNFTNAGGTAAADYIAKWNGSNWSALGTGTGGLVRTIAVGNDGKIYAGGDFTNLTDANGDYISVWNGSSWASMGSGMSAGVTHIQVDKDNNVYAAGNFGSAIGVPNTGRVAKWNGSAWSALGSGLGTPTAYDMEIDSGGNVYVAGDFTTAGSITVGHIAKWNGSNWSNVGATGFDNTVRKIAIGPDNNLYAVGKFRTVDGIALPDSAAMWTGSTWTPLDINAAGTAEVSSIEFDKAGVLYLGFDSNGTAYSATVKVANVGSAIAYPTIRFTGPGKVYQVKNYTTGKSIFFDGLTLLAGETAVLILDPDNQSFISSFRGDIWNYILPGSDLTFELLPGANNISAFMYGSTSAESAITMTWKNNYRSINAAVR